MIERSTRGGQDLLEVEGGAIDCDVHNAVPSIEALFPYLDDRWRDYCVEHGVTSLEPNYYPENADLSSRPGTKPRGGGPPGSDLGLVREQVLDATGVRYAVINCLYGVQLVHNEDWAAAMCRALNDWQVAEWLEKDGRLRASIVVPTRNPRMAAEEIERVGAHPGFVQVLLLSRSELTLGKRQYWPIYEAAERHGLPVGIHAGGSTGNPITPVGWPSYYIEDYASLAQSFQSQLISLITEGVFSKFPGLKAVMIESGFTWLPSLMWRLDKNWKGLRREVPWVDRLPSEFVHEHVRLTIQPFDGPQDERHLAQVLEQMGSNDLLLYASDYPHWHSGEHDTVLPEGINGESKRKIFVENARELYGL